MTSSTPLTTAPGGPLALAVGNLTAWLQQEAAKPGTAVVLPPQLTSSVGFAAVNLSAAAAQWLSTDGLTAVALTSVQTRSANLDSFVGDALDASAGLMPPGVSVALTGGARFSYDGNAALEPTILSSDEVTVPVSLLVLAVALRSLRAIALTVACLAAALLASVAALWPLTEAQPVPSFVVSLISA